MRGLFGDAFAQRLARTGFGIDAFARLIDQAGLAGFRALGRRGAFEIGVGQGQRRTDRHLRDRGLRDDGLRRCIDRRSEAGQFSRHAPIGGFDFGDIGKLGAREGIIKRRAQGRLFAAQTFEIARAGNDIAGGFTGPHRQFVRAGFNREPSSALLLICELRFDLGDPPLDLRQHQRHDIAADILAQPIPLPFQEIEFFGRIAAIDGAIHRLADGVKGVRGLPGDIVPGASKGVGRLFGVGQRRHERVQENPLRLGAIVLVNQRSDVLPRPVVEEGEARIQLIGATHRIGQGGCELLGSGLGFDAHRDGEVAGDADGAAHFFRADLAGAQEGDFHLARGGD